MGFVWVQLWEVKILWVWIMGVTLVQMLPTINFSLVCWVTIFDKLNYVLWILVIFGALLLTNCYYLPCAIGDKIYNYLNWNYPRRGLLLTKVHGIHDPILPQREFRKLRARTTPVDLWLVSCVIKQEVHITCISHTVLAGPLRVLLLPICGLDFAMLDCWVVLPTNKLIHKYDGFPADEVDTELGLAY
jgi:hypothetical protein